MRDLSEVIAEIKVICEEHPMLEDRLLALKMAGFDDIKYSYLRSDKVILGSSFQGLLRTAELTRKKVYRIQVGLSVLKKGYPVAWCVDVSSQDIKYEPELPF